MLFLYVKFVTLWKAMSSCILISFGILIINSFHYFCSIVEWQSFVSTIMLIYGLILEWSLIFHICFTIAGKRIFPTSRYTICWCKVGYPSSASTSWLSITRTQHTLPPWWVCNSCPLLLHFIFLILNSLLNNWQDVSYWQGSLQTLEFNKSSYSSINGLVSSFVTLLQVPNGDLLYWCFYGCTTIFL